MLHTKDVSVFILSKFPANFTRFCWSLWLVDGAENCLSFLWLNDVRLLCLVLIISVAVLVLWLVERTPWRATAHLWFFRPLGVLFACKYSLHLCRSFDSTNRFTVLFLVPRMAWVLIVFELLTGGWFSRISFVFDSIELNKASIWLCKLCTDSHIVLLQWCSVLSFFLTIVFTWPMATASDMNMIYSSSNENITFFSHT